LKCEAFDINKK